jgi:hypothetical protein
MKNQFTKNPPVPSAWRTFRKYFAGLYLTVMVLANASAGPLHFQSGNGRVSLVELYTSEGCSSCPPAEEWLGRLKDSPGLWTDFAPVAFHVDYWDALGWKDRWASAEFTDRQRAYAEAWKSDNVYTPCFVLDGREWSTWRFRKNPPGAGEAAGVLAVNSTDTNLWSAVFVPAGPVAAHYEIHAALLAGGLDSEVKAGENSGRRLQHEFVALKLVEIGMTTSQGVARARFLVDRARYDSEKTLALTVWVTRADELEPLQATGGWLVRP